MAEWIYSIGKDSRNLCPSVMLPENADIKVEGTIILPNLASVLLDPECWETPQQFNPGLFLDMGGNFLVNEAFLPFSADTGQSIGLWVQVGPGDQLALMELFLMFANPFRTFWFQLPEGSLG
ncbi:cytochrome P450 2U1-like [Lycaon pictus]